MATQHDNIEGVKPGDVLYLVAWEGWDPSYNSWEPEGNVEDSLIEEYKARIDEAEDEEAEEALELAEEAAAEAAAAGVAEMEVEEEPVHAPEHGAEHGAEIQASQGLQTTVSTVCAPCEAQIIDVEPMRAHRRSPMAQTPSVLAHSQPHSPL